MRRRGEGGERGLCEEGGVLTPRPKRAARVREKRVREK